MNTRKVKLSNITRIYLANFISAVGTWMTALLSFVWTYSQTNSATWLGLAMVSTRLPHILGPYLMRNFLHKNISQVKVNLDVLRFFVLLFMAIVVLEGEAYSPFVLVSIFYIFKWPSGLLNFPRC
jgi:hypothetical protein